MKNETLFPTPDEIRAYEIQAHQLRAETLKSGASAISRSIKGVFQRALAVLSRPAHA